MSLTTTSILNLPVGIGIDGSEQIPCVQGGTTKRIAAGLLIEAGQTGSTQSANTVFAGPTSGAAAAPSFRVLVAADIPASAINIGVGTTPVGGGTNTYVLYDNAGVLGNYTISGTGAVAMTTSPTFVTPTLGAATATSVTGASLFGGTGAASSLTLASTSGSGTTDSIRFQVASQAETARFVTTGELIKGYTARVAVGAAGTTFPAIQNHGTTVATVIENYRWSADASGPTLGLSKSRGAAIGTRGALSANDSLGSLIAHGDDGTNFISAAAIQALVDGTVSSGIVPARLTFQTATAAGTVTEAMRITSGQLVGIGNVSPVALLTLGTAGTLTGTLSVAGVTSGVVTIQPQAAAGTFNFNLPTTAGASGLALLSGGGGASPMTWGHDAAAGITVGTTAITSGTTTRILYDNAGVLGEYTITGTGTVVAMQTSPSFTTPTLGVATATTINKVTLTGPATGSTLTIADGKTLTVSNSLTLAGTDTTTMTFPTTSASIARTDAGQTFTGASTATSWIANTFDARGTWTTGTSWTLPAHTLGGTVSGGGNQINNVIIGTSTPLAGSFTTIAASTSVTVTSASAVALTVGLAGATNPALQVDASTASSATGLKIKSAAAAGGLALSVITSGTNENLTIDAAGSGTITLGGTSTGAIVHTRATTLSAALTYGGVTLSNSVTGTGSMVLSTSPTLVTPLLGTPTSGTLTNCTGLPVAGGGTGIATTTAYSVICAGTTATGAFQSLAALGASGTVLTSNGAGALPSFQSVSGTGTVTSITPGGGLTSTLTATAPGSAITGSGTLYGAELVNAQTGTSYAILDGDRAKLVTASNAAAQAYSIAQAGNASAFQAGWYVDLYNKSTNVAGIVTITPATSTINGASTLKVQPGQSVRIVSDGINYQAAFLGNAAQLPGTTTNDDANAGNLGEYASSVVASGSAVPLVGGASKNMTSMSLTAGDWDVNAIFHFTGNAATTVSYAEGSIGSTTDTADINTANTTYMANVTYFGSINGAGFGVVSGTRRFSLSGTTTVYAVAQANFGVNTMSVYGTMRARRVR